MTDQNCSNYMTDYRSITVRTIDGSTIHGKINADPTKRVSDVFTEDESRFIIMVDASTKESAGKVFFINKDHIVWVEPDD